jgi:hypothetical protein
MTIKTQYKKSLPGLSYDHEIEAFSSSGGYASAIVKYGKIRGITIGSSAHSIKEAHNLIDAISRVAKKQHITG